MSRKTIRFTLACGLAAAFLAVGPRTSRADDEGGGLSFHLDPLDVGVLWIDVDTNSSKFEEYEDRREGVVVPELHLFGSSSDGKRHLDLLATDITRDDSRWTLDYDVSGAYRLTLDFNQIVHRFGNGGRSVHSYSDSGIYSISDQSQSSLQQKIADRWAVSKPGVNYPFLSSLINPYIDASPWIDPRLKRDRTKAELEVGKMGDLAWLVDFNHENRKGSRPYGGSFGFSNVTELPEPIDYDTMGAGIRGEWRGSKAGATFGYNYSEFTNHLKTLLYDNPFRVSDSTDPLAYSSPGAGSIGGAATALNVLPPDNLAHTLSASARTRLGEIGWLDGNVSYSAMKQNDMLVPYSTNSAINPSSGAPFDVTDAGNLPVERADGDVRTLQIGARGAVDIGDDLTLTGRYRYYDYDNKSGAYEAPGYVRFEAVWEEIGRRTVPYGYSRWSLGPELSWDFAKGSHLTLSYDRRSMDRSFREIAESNDDVWKASLDVAAARGLTLRGSWEYTDRDIGEYLTEAQELSFTHPEGINNQPGLRKFDEAAKKVNDARVQLQYAANDKFDLSFGYGYRKDDFEESELGLIYDKAHRYDGEISYTPKADVTLYAWGARSDRNLFQIARQSGATLSTNPADNWELTLDEVTNVVGFGFNTTFASRWKLDLSGQWSNADGNSDFYSPPGGTPDSATGFPEYDDNEFFTLAVKLDYQLDDHFDMGLSYWRESYTADRFARDGLTNYMPATLLLNANDGDYAANMFAANVGFHF